MMEGMVGLIGLLGFATLPSMTIKQLDFMTGSWTAPRGQGVAEEIWMAPKGKTMLGISRTVRDDSTRFTEFLFIEESEGRLVLTLSPKPGEAALKFEATALTQGTVTFRAINDPNEATLTYRKKTTNEMEAIVEGKRSGTPYRIEFQFRRAS